MLYVLIVGGGIVMAVVNYCLRDQIYIVATAVSGSYLCVSGIGLFAKNFPSAVDIYNMIKNGTYDVITFITFPLERRHLLRLHGRHRTSGYYWNRCPMRVQET